MKHYLQLIWTNPAACRKAFAAFIGMALTLASAGLLPHYQWVSWIVAALTVLATYHVHNAPVSKKDKDELLIR